MIFTFATSFYNYIIRFFMHSTVLYLYHIHYRYINIILIIFDTWSSNKYSLYVITSDSLISYLGIFYMLCSFVILFGISYYSKYITLHDLSINYFYVRGVLRFGRFWPYFIYMPLIYLQNN